MNDGKDLFYHFVIIVVINYEIRFCLFYFIRHLIVNAFNHFSRVVESLEITRSTRVSKSVVIRMM